MLHQKCWGLQDWYRCFPFKKEKLGSRIQEELRNHKTYIDFQTKGIVGIVIVLWKLRWVVQKHAQIQLFIVVFTMRTGIPCNISGHTQCLLEAWECLPHFGSLDAYHIVCHVSHYIPDRTAKLRNHNSPIFVCQISPLFTHCSANYTLLLLVLTLHPHGNRSRIFCRPGTHLLAACLWWRPRCCWALCEEFARSAAEAPIRFCGE